MSSNLWLIWVWWFLKKILLFAIVLINHRLCLLIQDLSLGFHINVVPYKKNVYATSKIEKIDGKFVTLVILPKVKTSSSIIFSWKYFFQQETVHIHKFASFLFWSLFTYHLKCISVAEGVAIWTSKTLNSIPERSWPQKFSLNVK